MKVLITRSILLLSCFITHRQNGPLQSNAWQEPGHHIQISLADTGSGIAKDIQGKIFEPFFTTKDVGEGTGLGLSIWYGIIKNHKGTITVSSKTGVGTEITIRLPLDLQINSPVSLS